MKKPLGMMGTIVASAFGILFKNYVDTHDIDYISIILFMVIIVLAVYAIGYVLYIMLKDFIYMDGKRYDDLIDDINQVKIFASAGGEEIEEMGDLEDAS
ncbi:hypothetical protein [Butyrivibrio sp. INlla16]|uniref:hypothetical protein n=1 Tax=Butyrivibrio sp. INlla16 TaxID=1520807 RepID=UPI0011137106|nr:hypothetical protein [Butyrivibrio sp. INlla16]